MDYESKKAILQHLKAIKNILMEEEFDDLYTLEYYRFMLENLNSFIENEKETIQNLKQKKFYL